MTDQIAKIAAAFARAPADVRGEWLLRTLRACYAHLPGGSAIVGRGRFDDLDEAWADLAEADKLEWLTGLVRTALAPIGARRRGRP